MNMGWSRSQVIIRIAGICGFILLLSVPLLVFGVGDILKAKSSRNWPAVEGTIIRSGIGTTTRTGSSGKNASYQAEIRYRYVVDGSSMTGDTIKFGEVTNREIAGGYAHKYPKGKKVKVYYDPSRPETSVLEPGYSGGMLFGPVLALGCVGIAVLIGVAMWVFGFERESKEKVYSPYNFD